MKMLAKGPWVTDFHPYMSAFTTTMYPRYIQATGIHALMDLEVFLWIKIGPSYDRLTRLFLPR